MDKEISLMIQGFRTNGVGELITDNQEISGGWINVNDPTDEEITKLVKTFNFPRDYITSVLDENENSRQEMLKEEDEDAASLIVMQYPHLMIGELGYIEYVTLPISIILTKNTLITASKHTPLFITKMIQNQEGYKIDTTHQEQFVLRLLWHISASYIHFLNDIDDETKKLELQLTKSTKNEQLFALMALQKSLTYFLTAISSNRPILDIMKETDRFSKNAVARSFLHDVIVENEQAETMIHQYREILDQVSNVFSAVVSNNLNNIMKILTSITIVLTIPTIIGGIYGMNVDLPLSQAPNAFWIVLLLMLIISIITAWILKKKNYF